LEKKFAKEKAWDKERFQKRTKKKAKKHCHAVN